MHISNHRSSMMTIIITIIITKCALISVTLDI